VIFVPSAKSRALMILDAEPVEGGTIVIRDGLAHVLPKGLWGDGPCDEARYVDHHATCPKAGDWRRKK
jgi:hypothetical protein